MANCVCQQCNNRLQPTNDSISSNSRNRCGESTKYRERKVYKLPRGKGRKRAKSEKEGKKRGMEIMRIAWGTCPKLLPCHYPEENRQPRAYYLYLDACKHVCKCSYTRERHVCTGLQGQVEKLLGIKEKKKPSSNELLLCLWFLLVVRHVQSSERNMEYEIFNDTTYFRYSFVPIANF